MNDSASEQTQIDLQEPSSDSEQPGAVRGTVERVTFRNSENGYTVLQLAVEDARGSVTVVGHCLPFEAGSDIIVQGEQITHPRFGEQFQAQSANEIEPTTAAGIQKYLGSGLIAGVGPKTAERIVEVFGTRTLEVIYREPTKLRSVPGISKRKAESIHAALVERKDRLENERFFAEHDIGIGLARRIIDRYGEHAIAKVKKDPYLLAIEMRGIGFATADSLALHLGFEPTSTARLRGGLFYALQKAMDDGHCFLTLSVLLERTQSLLKLDTVLDFTPHIESLVADKFIISVEDRVYIKRLYDAEQMVARFVAERLTPYEQPLVPADTMENCLNQAEQELGLTFSFEQRNSVALATTHPFLVITGGPGCGKTTIIRALASTFVQAGKVLALAAPTGKAAQRMSQVTGMNAKTIHRLLKFDPRTNAFQYNATAPLCLEDHGSETEIDILIIDEASMLDIQLCRDLFSAIPLHATVILVGDKDQLPSVGPGRVFAELVSIPELKIISLSKLFRRSEESKITTIAHSINAGIIPDFPEPDGVTKSDLYFIEKDDADACARVVESLVTDQIPRKFNIPLEDITVLTPSNRGPIGTIELNERLQEKLNPAATQSSMISTQRGDFRLGDRVCQRVNNYKIDLFGVFNGDIGTVYQLDESNSSVVVELWDGRLIQYNEKDLQQLSLSYAMTVHRSQGSEMPCVVLVLHTSHFTLLERQLFYTAITRAKQLLILVGSKRALALAANRTSSKKRLTSLKEAIQAAL